MASQRSLGSTSAPNNPYATYPLEPDNLPGAAHHYLMADGQVQTTAPGWQPLSSVTKIIVLPNRNSDV